MRKCILLIFSIAFAAFPLVTNAQGPGSRPGGPPWQKGCASLEELDLSGEQRSAIDRVNAEHSAQVARFRDELLERRLEVEALLKDPNAAEETIRNKAAEMVRAHNRLQEKMMDYQIRLRAILTPEQLRRWCTLMGPGPGKGRWGMP